MNTQDIANDLVALWRAGDFSTAGEKYWADDVVSVEAMGDAPVSHGIEAARGKGEWWGANHDVHSIDVTEPFVNGDQFVVRMKMDVTFKGNGQRMTMDEAALYTLRDGKIAEERFFYGG